MISCEYCEISKSTYFEDHLHTAAFEVTLGIGCLWLFSGESLSKPSRPSNITKIPVAFKPELETQFGKYTLFKFSPYAFF